MGKREMMQVITGSLLIAVSFYIASVSLSQSVLAQAPFRAVESNLLVLTDEPSFPPEGDSHEVEGAMPVDADTVESFNNDAVIKNDQITNSNSQENLNNNPVTNSSRLQFNPIQVIIGVILSLVIVIVLYIKFIKN